jgi:Zn-dependent protease
MLNLLLTDPLAFLIIFPGLMVAITIHEFAHAWVADRLGDPTPRYQDRVTLDPRQHLDPIGTISILLIGFGWGRPVEFDPYNLKTPVRDTALIALAGPVSNLIIAGLLSLILQSGSIQTWWILEGIFQVLVVNIGLAVFNMVPVYPLDGSKILLALLPRQTALEYDHFMHRYGTMVLVALLVPWLNGLSPVSLLVSPIISMIVNILV